MKTRDRTSTLAVAVTAIALIACAAVVVWAVTSDRRSESVGPEQSLAESEGPGEAAPVETIGRAPEPEGIRIYRVWQGRRIAAWADGDPAALRRLYVAPRVARGDVRQMRQWLARGASGVTLTHQVLAYEVERESETTVRLRVTHRVARAVVHSDGPDIALPRGGAMTQVVVLQRSREQWRVARVRSAR